MSKTLLILGGYGNTGRLIAELLLKETSVNLLLAGRNVKKAQLYAEILNQQSVSQRVAAIYADAADKESLQKFFSQVELVIAASSTAEYTKNVAEAAIAAKIDYLDIQYSTGKIKILRALQSEIERAGCCFITEGGFHPGLPAVLIRYVAPYFDSLETANVSSLIAIHWKSFTFSEATAVEMVQEFKDFQPLVFKKGHWVKLGWNMYKSINFGRTFGHRYCVPLFFEELRELPQQIPTLNETGFYIAGFDGFTNYLVIPLGILALTIAPNAAKKPFARIFTWSLKNFCRPPYGTILRLEACGIKNGQSSNCCVQLSHENGYVLTAVPVVACLLQYLNGDIRKTGVWCQGNVVEPRQMLRDMARLGIVIEEMEC